MIARCEQAKKDTSYKTLRPKMAKMDASSPAGQQRNKVIASAITWTLPPARLKSSNQRLDVLFSSYQAYQLCAKPSCH